MERDATGEIGHHGFLVDAQAMTALLFDFATQPAYREVVQREFAAIKGEFAAYQRALKTAYPLPVVPDPKYSRHGSDGRRACFRAPSV